VYVATFAKEMDTKGGLAGTSPKAGETTYKRVAKRRLKGCPLL
jgi:hypothetical protein